MCNGHLSRRPKEGPENHPTEQKMRDAYWNAKDEFEHDIRELWAQYISPEEFEKKWRARFSELEHWLNVYRQLNKTPIEPPCNICDNRIHPDKVQGCDNCGCGPVRIYINLKVEQNA